MIEGSIKEQLKEIIKSYPFVPFSRSSYYPQDRIADYLLHEIYEAAETKKARIEINEEKSCAFVAHSLPWDTQLFGISMARISHAVYRGSVSRDALLKMTGSICERLKEEGVRHISCVLNPAEMLFSEVLEEAGFHLKGILVDYYIRLKDFSHPDSSSPADIRPAEKAEAEKIADIALDAFSRKEDWYDRFHADPFFPKEKSDRLYREWLLNSFFGDQADQVLGAYLENEPVGFITLKMEKEKSRFFGFRCGNVPLNAVDINQRRKGIYRDLVIAGLDWFKDRKVGVACVRTQASTLAVQKVWQRLGAEVAFYHLVFHKNFK